MSKKSKWDEEADDTIVCLQAARMAFSRAGLYLTSLLLNEVLRVAEYEIATERARHKELSRKKK